MTQPRAILRFANGKFSIIHEQYFPGWPEEIDAHGLEGGAYEGTPVRRRFRRAEDEVMGWIWHGETWPVYVEVTEKPGERRKRCRCGATE